ncbi:PilZ domain-containing protein [Candidatus Omnitrophota bacterium]
MYRKIDRRLFERIQGDITARYSVEDGEIQHFVGIRDISGGGLKIELLKGLTPGTILDVEIFRKNSNISARCKSEIIWVRTLRPEEKRGSYFEAGVKFLALNFMYIGAIINDLETQGTRQLC